MILGTGRVKRLSLWWVGGRAAGGGLCVGGRELTYTEFNVEIGDFQREYLLATVVMEATGLGNPIREHVEELGVATQTGQMCRGEPSRTVK